MYVYKIYMCICVYITPYSSFNYFIKNWHFLFETVLCKRLLLLIHDWMSDLHITLKHAFLYSNQYNLLDILLCNMQMVYTKFSAQRTS